MNRCLGPNIVISPGRLAIRPGLLPDQLREKLFGLFYCFALPRLAVERCRARAGFLAKSESLPLRLDPEKIKSISRAFGSLQMGNLKDLCGVDS